MSLTTIETKWFIICDEFVEGFIKLYDKKIQSSISALTQKIGFVPDQQRTEIYSMF